MNWRPIEETVTVVPRLSVTTQRAVAVERTETPVLVNVVIAEVALLIVAEPAVSDHR
jgi:hypothetical protein